MLASTRAPLGDITNILNDCDELSKLHRSAQSEVSNFTAEKLPDDATTREETALPLAEATKLLPEILTMPGATMLEASDAAMSGCLKLPPGLFAPPQLTEFWQPDAEISPANPLLPPGMVLPNKPSSDCFLATTPVMSPTGMISQGVSQCVVATSPVANSVTPLLTPKVPADATKVTCTVGTQTEPEFCCPRCSAEPEGTSKMLVEDPSVSSVDKTQPGHDDHARSAVVWTREDLLSCRPGLPKQVNIAKARGAVLRSMAMGGA